LCRAFGSCDPDASAAGLRETALRIEKAHQAIEDAQRELATAERTLKANRAVGNQPDWSLLLALLARNLGDQVVLSQCELKPDVPGEAAVGAAGASDQPRPARGGFILKLAGYGETQPDVSRFVLNLERAGLFDQVRLVRTSSRAFLSASAIAFELECGLGGQDASRR
jgi:hypothetical protein